MKNNNSYRDIFGRSSIFQAAAWVVTITNQTEASTKCFFSMAVLVDQFHKLESNRLFQGNILLKSKF